MSTSRKRNEGRNIRAGRCRSDRTCRSTDGPCGRPSAQVMSAHMQQVTEDGTYEDTRTTLGGRALATKTLDLAVRLHLVVLEDGHLDLLALVLDLLGGLNASHIINTNMSPASRQMQRTLYVFFLRFLAPPRRRSTRWRVDSFWML